MTVGPVPAAIALADLDRDGALDLVCGHIGASPLVTVSAGGGDGSFGPARGYGQGTWARSVAVADLDRDGRLDLVAAAFTQPTAVVLLGR